MTEKGLRDHPSQKLPGVSRTLGKSEIQRPSGISRLTAPPAPRAGWPRQGEPTCRSNSPELPADTGEEAGLGTESRGGRRGSKVGSGEGSRRGTWRGPPETGPFRGGGLEGALRGSSRRGRGRGATRRDGQFCSPLLLAAGSSRCPLGEAGPGCGRGALPTVLPVVMLPLAPHHRGSPAAAAARLLQAPLGAGSAGAGVPWEGRTDRQAAAPPSPEPGGAAQTGLTGPPERQPRDGLADGGEGRGRPGGAAAAPATHRPPDLALSAPPTSQLPSPHGGTLASPRTPGAPLRPNQATPPAPPLSSARAPLAAPFSRYGN